MSSIVPLWEENWFMTMELYGRVLDAGCGNGHYSIMLRDIPMVTSIYSMDILSLHRELWSIMTTENFIQGDVQNLPFANDSFDCVFCWRVLQYVEDLVKTLSEFRRIATGFIMVRMPIDPHGVPKPGQKTFREESAQKRADAFTWRTYCDVYRFERSAKLAGLRPECIPYVDRSVSQVWLLRRC